MHSSATVINSSHLVLFVKRKVFLSVWRLLATTQELKKPSSKNNRPNHHEKQRFSIRPRKKQPHRRLPTKYSSQFLLCEISSSYSIHALILIRSNRMMFLHAYRIPLIIQWQQSTVSIVHQSNA